MIGCREYRTGTGGGDTCIDIENTDDTDSNKTEVTQSRNLPQQKSKNAQRKKDV